MNAIEKSILETLAYFDIFQHPLIKDEITSLCISPQNPKELEHRLKALISEKKCYSYSGYYSLQSNVKQLVLARKSKEKRAQLYFKKLPRYSKIIKSFPFVRGVAISGSLSKSVMHEDGDIDYFIISAPGRLWICRTLLILFKKIFLLNSKKYFCVNYFIDEENLEIIDKNIFTAIEINYLASIYNHQLIERMKAHNSWTKSYFPTFKHSLKLEEIKKNERLKKYLELPLKGKIGDQLDFLLMKRTYKRWSKKFKHFDSSKLELTMRSNRGVSKHHPRDFQTKVLKEYSKRLEQLNLCQ